MGVRLRLDVLPGAGTIRRRPSRLWFVGALSAVVLLACCGRAGKPQGQGASADVRVAVLQPADLKALSSPMLDLRVQVTRPPGFELRVWAEGFKLLEVPGGKHEFRGRVAVKRGTHALRITTCLGRDPMLDAVEVFRFEYTVASSAANQGDLERLLLALHGVDASAAIHALGELDDSPDPECLQAVARLASRAESNEVRKAAANALGSWLTQDAGHAILEVMQFTLDPELCAVARLSLRRFLLRQGLPLSDNALERSEEIECGVRDAVAVDLIRASDELFQRLLG